MSISNDPRNFEPRDLHQSCHSPLHFFPPYQRGVFEPRDLYPKAGILLSTLLHPTNVETLNLHRFITPQLLYTTSHQGP
ncbi:hypothetical protein TNCV_3856581 [Trichonephila clavipes]|nr:hypothetical protein TNCV_3856581 [Trichonephila clavipes]